MFQIEAIYIPEEYKGVGSFHQSDIAIAVIKGEFHFTLNVQPVCMDWSNMYEVSDRDSGVVRKFTAIHVPLQTAQDAENLISGCGMGPHRNWLSFRSTERIRSSLYIFRNML